MNNVEWRGMVRKAEQVFVDGAPVELKTLKWSFFWS